MRGYVVTSVINGVRFYLNHHYMPTKDKKEAHVWRYAKYAKACASDTTNTSYYQWKHEKV